MAGRQFSISAVFEGVDRLSAPIRRIGENIRGLSAPIAAANAALSRMGDSNAMQRLSMRTANFRASLRSANEAMGGFGAGVAALGGAASAGEAWNQLKQIADLGSHFNDAAKKTGLAAAALQEWEHVAKMSGVSGEAVSGSMVKMMKNATQAAHGNKELSAVFKGLHVNVKNADGSIKSADQLMMAVSDSLNDISDPAKRATAAMAVFGKSGAEMLPLISEGSAKINEELERFRELKGGFTDKMIEDADAFGDSIDHVGAALTGAQGVLGGQLFPILAPMLEKFATWISQNQELVGWIIKIGTAAAVAVGVIAALGIVVPIVVSGFAMLGTALMAVGSAIAAVGALLMANPIGLAVAAIAGAVYLIYANWDGIVTYFTTLWDNVKAGFQEGFMQGMIALLVNFNPWKILVDGFYAAIAEITGFDLKGAIGGMVSGLGGMLGIGTAAPAIAPAGAASIPTGAAQRIGDAATGTAQNGVVKVQFENVPPGVIVAKESGGGVQTQVQQNLGARKITN